MKILRYSYYNTLQSPVIIITTTNTVEHLYNGHFGTSSQLWSNLLLSFTFTSQHTNNRAQMNIHNREY